MSEILTIVLTTVLAFAVQQVCLSCLNAFKKRRKNKPRKERKNAKNKTVSRK